MALIRENSCYSFSCTNTSAVFMCCFEIFRHDDHLHISEGDDFCSKESNDEKWVTLNVGGKLFTTTSMALTAKEPFSMLARMFAADSGSCSSSPSCRDASGAYLIDQSPTYFEPILNFLRHGKLILDEGVNPEGMFLFLECLHLILTSDAQVKKC